jgi:hypothetical protein
MFRRKTKIELLCEKTRKWAVVRFDKVDYFTVRTLGPCEVYSINIRHHRKHTSTLFQTWLPVNFSLGNTPSGLFGKLLLRSWDLNWSAWGINIGDSCEAIAAVSALVPTMALDAELFDDICREQTEEVAAMHKELRDKFKYAGQSGGSYAHADVRQAASGVPMRRPDNLPKWRR